MSMVRIAPSILSAGNRFGTTRTLQPGVFGAAAGGRPVT